MSNQRRILSAAAASIVVIVIASIVIFRVAQGSGNSSALDAGLKQRGDRLLSRLSNSNGKLPIPDATLNSYKAWVYNLQAQFIRVTHGERGGIYEQLLLSDPSVMPPQAVVLNEPSRAGVAVDPAVVSKALQVGVGQYTISRLNSRDLRVYAVPLQVPTVLQPAGITGVLEVMQAET